MSSTPVRARAAATSATRFCGTVPSIEQPNAVATAASMRMGRAWARTQSTMARTASTCSSVLLFTLARLWVSLAEIGMPSTWAPASWAAMAPLRLAASA